VRGKRGEHHMERGGCRKRKKWEVVSKRELLSISLLSQILMDPYVPYSCLLNRATLADPVYLVDSRGLELSQTLTDPHRPSQTLTDPHRPSQTLADPHRPSQTLTNA
jgi:hypothetical protein